MSSQRCPVCSSPVPASALACPTCGAPLAGGPSGGGDPELVGVLPAGTRLNGGSFSIGRMLGRGGFGITYLGADLRLKRPVAIKEFFPAGSSRRGASVLIAGALGREDYELAIQKFEQEAQMLARFRHRSIVNVYEVFRENDTAYMAMEYLEGENLIERMERRNAPLPEAELVAFTGPISEALDEVHAAGILHRDIKPQNIMLIGAEHAPRPVLIDFGAAREFASGMANRHSIMLTPGYAPLEQYGEQARRGPFTDIYALAATLYHMATGEQPPAATERALGIALKPPRTLNPALGAGFEAAILHGMQMKVDERPQQATEFHRELAGGAPGAVPAVPPRTSAPSPVPNPSPRPPAPSPTPVPPSPGSGGHIERVREIAKALQRSGGARTDRFVCPICRNAEMRRSSGTSVSSRCPVCRAADLRERFSPSGPALCPSCSRGELQPLDGPAMQPGVMMPCPACRSGAVAQYVRSQMLFVPDVWAQCDTCGADFDYHVEYDSLTLMDLPGGPGYLSPDSIGQTRTRAAWAALAGGGTAEAYGCGVCGAEFHPCAEGKLEWVALDGDPGLVPPEHRGQCWSRLLWAKIAHHVPIDDGNVGCPSCDAQFDEAAPGQLTLLRADRDPYGVLAANRGRTYPTERWSSMAGGGGAPVGPGLVCPSCDARLEERGRGDALALAAYEPGRDRFGVGGRYSGRTLGADDWRRVAAGGVPAAEEEPLREEARREFWAALLAGEISTSAAEQSYPVARADGEHVVITFGAVRLGSRFGFLYEQDSGQVWLSTRQLLYRGGRAEIAIPLREAARCDALEAGQGDPVIVVTGRDGSELLRFGMGRGPVEFVVEGLALHLRWDEQAFVELFESLRRRV